MQRTAVPDTGTDVQTVARAGALLFAFSVERPEIGLSQLAAELSLSKATVHRLAQTLVGLGLLEQNSATRGYRLGVKLLRLSHVVESSLDLRREARAALRRLRDVTGETVYLIQLRGEEAVCVERIEGSHPMRDLSTPPGTIVPLTIGAAGTAILSTLDDESVDAEVAGLSPEHRTDVLRRVELARRNGYAMTKGDIAQGVGAIAAALSDARGTTMGAISLGGLLERVEHHEQALGAAVREAAADVTVAMGWNVE